MSDLGFISFDDYMLNDPKNVGMLLFKQTVQVILDALPFILAFWYTTFKKNRTGNPLPSIWHVGMLL